MTSMNAELGRHTQEVAQHADETDVNNTKSTDLKIIDNKF